MRKDINVLKVNEDGWEGWAVTVDGSLVAKVDQTADGECEVHVFTNKKTENPLADFESKVY